MPLISVVMPVRNGLPYLADALESLFTQSLQDFELIVIDDASKDATADLLKSIADRRLRVITNRSPQGISRSLNRIIKLARGKFIARMDHDDISLRERFANQIDFFTQNPRVDILGTWAQTIGLGKEKIWKYPTQDEDIRSELIFSSTLVHSSVMFRASSFRMHKLAYNPATGRAQDFELWSRAAGKLGFANLDQVLLRYRIHPRQVGSRFGPEQQDVAANVRKKFIDQLGLKPTSKQLKLHNQISTWHFPATKAGLTAIESWLMLLLTANQAKQVFPPQAFRNALERRWWEACKACVSLGAHAREAYRNSELAGANSLFDQARFWMKTTKWEYVR